MDSPAAATLRPFFAGLKQPWIVAHRGGPDQWPENTLEAFRQAVADGFTLLETDLRPTRDGVLVTLHDDTVQRTTEGRGRVRDCTFAELQRFDAAYRFAPARGYPLRGEGVRIPSFEEVVALLPEARFIVDLKQDGLEEPLAELIRRRDLADRLLVGSFHDDRLLRFRRLTQGRVATCAGRLEIASAWLASRMGRRTRPPCDAFVVPRRHRGLPLADRRFVRFIHESNLPVLVWTVNDEAIARRLIARGADGVITDRPARLRAALPG